LRDVSNRLDVDFSNLAEENEALRQIYKVKEKPKEVGYTITSILGAHFNNGIRIDSPIELKRFRKFSLEYFGRELPLSDEKLKDEIMKSGLFFEGKVYSLSEQTKDSLRKTAISAFQSGCGILFYSSFFDKHESWLINEAVLSAEMLKVILKSVCSDYIYKRSYFTNNPNNTIDKELVKCFEQNIILSFEQLVEMLQYIPLATVKWILSQNPDFIWNSVGSYTHMSRFEITEKEKQSIINYAEEQTKRKGYFSLADLPLMDIAERNYELSVAALHNAVFRICFDGKYERRGKIVTHKGIELNAFEITKQYCRTLDRCSLEELLAFEKELTGEIHHWISIGAAYSEMVRIDATTFVSKKKVKFDVDAIDAVLEEFCPGDYIPLISVTTFAAFPHVRQPWTHFLLESYVRLFSHKYRFEVLSVNSRNCGAIVRKSCELDYPAIMIDAVAKSTVTLNKREVLEFLYVNGYIGKRSWSGLDTLLKQAKKIRERRH
jgi:hypothetical protein